MPPYYLSIKFRVRNATQCLPAVLTSYCIVFNSEVDIRRHISCEVCDKSVTGGYDPYLNQVRE